jgi:hypothetical protein
MVAQSQDGFIEMPDGRCDFGPGVVQHCCVRCLMPQHPLHDSVRARVRVEINFGDGMSDEMRVNPQPGVLPNRLGNLPAKTLLVFWLSASPWEQCGG